MKLMRLTLPALLLCACNPPSMPPQPPSPPVTPQVTQTAAPQPAAAGSAIPAAFHGRWDASLASCNSASEMRLTVEPGALRFWESHGEVVSVSAAGPQEARVQLAMSGEGETWSRDILMSLGEDGSLDLDGVKRVRCPA